MAPTPKERAVTKTKLEISKDVSDLIHMAKSCGLGELQYFLHYLHASRLLNRFGNVPDSKQEMVGFYVRSLDNAYKYLIQLVAKHCKGHYVRNNINNHLIDTSIIKLMTRYALEVNGKFEMLSFLTTFRNLEVYGERDQHVKFNLEEIIKDNYLSKYFNYAFRSSRENDFNREPKPKDDLILQFKHEYEPYADLFQKEFNISIDEFLELFNWIIEKVRNRIKSKEKNFDYTEDGRVDGHGYKTIMLLSFTFFFKKDEIKSKFGEKVNKVLNRLTFEAMNHDENELRFNNIERQPIIEKGDYYIISPEILLDSLFVNSHYSLLEASAIREEYKKRYSKIFVDKIVRIANEVGFEEFDRDFELYEGKNQIGDIDLILKNYKNEFLLIEAKNHSLSLDVYFHDFDATEKRLTYLKTEWEKKVNKRSNHLKANHNKYGISSNFKYLVISKFPEIISHFSDNLFLSLNEFRYWLNERNLETTFQSIYEKIYNTEDSTITNEQLDSISRDLLKSVIFSKE